MAGKNHVEKSFRLQWDDSGGTTRDLSGDLVPGSISGGGLVFDEADMTGVSNTVYNFLADRATSEISATFHLNDTATTGAFTVLKATGGLVGTLTMQWGQNGAAPTTNDPEWEGEYVLLSNNVTLDGNKAVINCTWKPSGRRRQHGER
ncbi:MAG: hypothetical protein IPH82_30225 [Chloroflexi bacterium]|nr:hypothetical protein [Chloroflexota bacterium]